MDEKRFSGPGLTGQNDETRLEDEPGFRNEHKIFELELKKHALEIFLC